MFVFRMTHLVLLEFQRRSSCSRRRAVQIGLGPLVDDRIRFGFVAVPFFKPCWRRMVTMKIAIANFIVICKGRRAAFGRLARGYGGFADRSIGLFLRMSGTTGGTGGYRRLQSSALADNDSRRGRSSLRMPRRLHGGHVLHLECRSDRWFIIVVVSAAAFVLGWDGDSFLFAADALLLTDSLQSWDDTSIADKERVPDSEREASMIPLSMYTDNKPCSADSKSKSKCQRNSLFRMQIDWMKNKLAIQFIATNLFSNISCCKAF